MTDTPEPAALGNWMIIAGFLISVGCNALSLWASTRPKPANHEVYARKDELEKVETTMKAEVAKLDTRHSEELQLLHDRISGQGKHLTACGDARADRIIKAIDDHSHVVRADLAGVHKRITGIEREVARVDERTKRLS